ncbi:MAG: TRAP transporter substrate-binding protein [Oscillospiraceae bacterium]|nr:TRAP transporter substrate-binding protein [Oscillospiraceae bacterium]
MKKIIALLLAVLLVAGLAACGGGTTPTPTPAPPAGGATPPAETPAPPDQVFHLRASTNLAAVGTVGQALQYFVDLVNERSGGRIVATANFGAEHGSQAEQVEMTRIGALDMVVASPGSGLGPLVPELASFELPFSYDDNDHFRRVLLGMEEEVSARVEPFGFVAMAGQSQGARHLLTQRPVRELGDLQGLVMRGPNATYVAMFEHLGAAGTTTDWNEVYTALQTGVIDGAEASPDMLNSMSFQDQAQYLTITGHIIANVFYFFNEAWWNALPADLQELIREAARDAAIFQGEIDDIAQVSSLEAMIADGVEVIELQDIEAWRAAVAPMEGEFRARGAHFDSFIDAIRAIR